MARAVRAGARDGALAAARWARRCRWAWSATARASRGDAACSRAVVLVVALGAVLMLVVDLDRPQEGFLQVSQQALLDVQQWIGLPSS